MDEKEVICVKDYITAFCSYKKGDRVSVVSVESSHYYTRGTLYTLLREYFTDIDNYRDIQLNNILN
jgi:hypothetical protein